MKFIDRPAACCLMKPVNILGHNGAELSFRGLPCPNLGTGGEGFHGPFEHITVEAMEHVVQILIEIAKNPV